MDQRQNIHKYFREILREFFDVGTPIYYRVHLSNAKTILQEIKNYIASIKDQKDLNMEHVKKLSEEFIYLSSKDIVCKSYIHDIFTQFSTFIKKEFIDATDPKKEKITELVDRIEPLIQLFEKTYFDKSVELLFNILQKQADQIEPKDFTKLKKVCFSFSTEILRKGYSKRYIYYQILDHLTDDIFTPEILQQFTGLFDEKSHHFFVLIKLQILAEKDVRQDILQVLRTVQDIKVYEGECPDKFKTLPQSVKRQIGRGKDYVKNDFNKFIEQRQNDIFAELQVKALDHESAIQAAIGETYKLFDLIKWEFPKAWLEIKSKAISSLSGENVFLPILTQLDGHKRPASFEVFERRKERINNIFNSEYTDSSAKEKVKTLLRFYRYFSESDTLEHKFINLWIGWEHVFSLRGSSKPMWYNIHTIFPKLHAIGYLHNIFLDMLNVQFKRNIDPENSKFKDDRTREMNKLLSPNVKYQITNLYSLLKQEDGFQNLINLPILERDDLTKVKLYRLRKRVEKPGEFIERRKKQVEWDLFRMYRIRNTILHQGNVGVLGIPLEIMVSLLETYYLELLDVITNRLTISNRFKNIEQLFLSFVHTYDKLITKSNKEEISTLKTPEEIKRRIIDPPLVY